MNSQKKLLIIIGGVFIVLIVITWLFTRQANQNDELYYDPVSGETIRDPDGITPEQFGTPSDLPIFPGITKLLDYGITQEQLDSVKTAFYLYTSSRGISQVSIDVGSVERKATDPDSDEPEEMTFKVQMNRQDDYFAKVEYELLGPVRLYLYRPGSDQVIFDSGEVEPGQEPDDIDH